MFERQWALIKQKEQRSEVSILSASKSTWVPELRPHTTDRKRLRSSKPARRVWSLPSLLMLIARLMALIQRTLRQPHKSKQNHS
jgi:hypothetical protein